ncbi:Holliday junction branch migration protein RuvA [Candidatus Desantisbacteria bacterium CG_4_9_14_3_um_filter_40_11]|uniref:Holliday junction branch migration complex subunit RuvA n=5 Tax=unclassified Candidatus Desantisiibacteriota TaxID=3106372 RepID=A0A2M7JDX9_9BACT|nr:MAG: Holliday junction branch migration protein RuvA [Candidatus Desantisbacteria bacterium CG23_combo_of_CG06-09_8_20_14_all_40_23]PIX17597.1 MAG: Holliday junction branch migration protein RuvA [Candidatus Desantisbacteria bacterium CG_4_8_14_3_um_filter_40_12]PIY19240.1 MAG: Holliday junction branch migration protein RuvA [Candidatus Desantisbacteria bacterium CG_4_10_14_3_um_filter_40_18]PJB29028.1 MAG: Holliday junction branch migration protein RuvA [Candidatus Desantisbacteria bacterium
MGWCLYFCIYKCGIIKQREVDANILYIIKASEGGFHMIDTISGKLIKKLPTYALIDVGGVGYGIHIPISTYHQLSEPNETVTLFTHLVVREDSLLLYGFFTADEKRIFLALISVSGIGARTALAVLSTLSAEEFEQSVIRDDVKRLTGVAGVGKKSAQRIILELKEKFSTQTTFSEIVPLHGEEVKEDAIMALVSLGYKRTAAQVAVQKAEGALGSIYGIEDLIKTALRFLS